MNYTNTIKKETCSYKCDVVYNKNSYFDIDGELKLTARGMLSLTKR